jgi:hypothetical protein
METGKGGLAGAIKMDVAGKGKPASGAQVH